MSLTKLSLAGNNFIIPGKGEFGKWHPSWGRENRQTFLTVLEPHIKSEYILYGWRMKTAELHITDNVCSGFYFFFILGIALMDIPMINVPQWLTKFYTKLIHLSSHVFAHMNIAEEWDVVQCLNCFIRFYFILFIKKTCFGINEIFTLWRGIHTEQLPTLMISFN